MIVDSNALLELKSYHNPHLNVKSEFESTMANLLWRLNRISLQTTQHLMQKAAGLYVSYQFIFPCLSFYMNDFCPGIQFRWYHLTRIKNWADKKLCVYYNVKTRPQLASGFHKWRLADSNIKMPVSLGLHT